MKSVLFYTDTPAYGGAERQMELLAEYLPQQGYRVSLACGSYGQLNIKNPAVYANIFKISAWHKHDPRHYLGLKKLLKNNNFDLIHLHLWNPGACRYAFWAAKQAGIPVIVTEHDPFPLTGLKNIIKQKCVRIADQIIVVSQDNYRQVRQAVHNPEKRLNIVHNGIKLDTFMDMLDNVSNIVQHEKKIISCIGELHPRKGHRYLIEAFQQMQPDFPELELHIAGTGPAESELKQKYGHLKGVRFLGWIKEVAPLLKKSTLFVLPSPNEAFGLVLLEAMASGTLVIAANQGGPKDIIEHGQSGYLVQPKSAKDLARQICYALTHPEEREQIEKNALIRVKKHFNAEGMAAKTAVVYQKLI